jgi:hypothetical protein
MVEPMKPPEEEGRRSTPPSMPRWVKVSVLMVAILAVVLVIIMLQLGGEHGPGLHTGAADSTGGWLLIGAMDSL